MSTSRRTPSRRTDAPPLSISQRALLRDGSDEAFREMIYLMVLSLGRLQVCREAFGRRIGLTGSQFAVLIGTSHRQGGEGVTIRDLARHVQLADTHVTTEVRRLMRRGLLSKQPNPDDGRSVRVSLTPRGRRALEDLAPYLRGVNDILFRQISRSEFEALLAFFRKFAANTEAALASIGALSSGRRFAGSLAKRGDAHNSGGS